MVHVKKRKIEQKVTVYQGKGKHTTIKQSLAVCNSIDNVKNEPLPSTRHEFIHHPDEPTKDPPKTVVQAPETSNYYIFMLFLCKELLQADQCPKECSTGIQTNVFFTRSKVGP